MGLSTREIPSKERLIVALDVSNPFEAIRLVNQLGDSVQFYKIGLELFSSGGADGLIKLLKEQGKKVFVDLKLHDIPETVKRATINVAGIEGFLTIHSSVPVMKAAVAGVHYLTKETRGLCRVKLLAVTVLTSMDREDLLADGYDLARLQAPEGLEVPALVLERAKNAKAIGCAGVIASPQEASVIRSEVGEDFLIVTPGVRPEGMNAGDQKRVTTPRQAFLSGSDYIVVGRPIRDAPSPREAAEAIQQTISSLFAVPT